MRRTIPILLLVAGFLIVLNAMRPPSYDSDLDLDSFARMPVQYGGRVLPIDSVARNTLRILSGRQSLTLPDGQRIPASTWMATVAFEPEKADTYAVFRIDNAEVLGLFGWEQEDRKYFSFNELEPHFASITEQNSRVSTESQLRSPFESQLVKLHNALSLYHQMIHSFHPMGALDRLTPEYALWENSIGPGREALDLQQAGQAYSEEDLQRFIGMADRYLHLARNAALGIVPPRTPDELEENHWANVGSALLDAIVLNGVDPILYGYAQLTESYRKGDAETFNRTLEELHTILDQESSLARIYFEYFFNYFAPFYQSIVLYILIILLVGFSWLRWGEPLQRSAYWLLILAFVVHSFGLLARMYIQGRPPVTNLYSSAIFVGWGSVLLGIVLERMYRNGIGSFTAAFIGFVTLIIAHNLAATGDTLEMMRAVLDSNFWLATHVVVITMGYSAVFLAGALGILYVIQGIFTSSLDRETARNLVRMAYGITCFGLLFNFVGTMLGGIWADQSWGRFWGWDPKENGALIIVLWGALMLHARWGKLVQDRGFMLLAIGGNIITSWSWFGTNMLGIGLHSYGFMDAAFLYLIAFWASQVFLISLGLLPAPNWKSRPAIFPKR